MRVRVTSAALGLALLAPAASAGAASAWSDPTSVRGTTLTAATVAAPGALQCSPLGIASLFFSWPAVPGATRYTFHYGTNGTSTRTVLDTETSLLGLIAGGTAFVVADVDLGSVTWHSSASPQVQYLFLGVALCG